MNNQIFALLPEMIAKIIKLFDDGTLTVINVVWEWITLLLNTCQLIGKIKKGITQNQFFICRVSSRKSKHFKK